MLGVQVDLGPAFCDCPGNEMDLLTYLQQMAAARGIVTEQVQPGNDGLPSAPAAPSRTPPTPPRSAVSDETGLVIFRDLKFERYQIKLRREGYLVASESEASLIVKLDENKRSSDVSVSLVPTVTISGHLRDARGVPVANALVVSTRVRDDTSNAKFPQRTARVINGLYTLAVEARGEFILRAQTTSPGLIPEMAKYITVEVGKNLTDVDFEFPDKN